MFRGLRRRVARTIEREGLYPWLEVCCGTGDQLRHTQVSGEKQLRGHVPEVRVPEVGDRPIFGLDLSLGFLRYARARAPHIPFVCGDAARLPFKDRSLRAVSVSFGLHDKSLELRSAILSEARRVLRPDGRLIAVDFENPWDSASRAGALFTRAVELFAGRTHYDNGRDFLRRGGLRGFLKESGFVEVARRDVPIGSLGIVVARVDADAP
jgi:ubiquinone/menaquinone biosynthesis C-methylase UbiE